jgi:hypothetical protein
VLDESAEEIIKLPTGGLNETSKTIEELLNTPYWIIDMQKSSSFFR